MSEVEVDVGEPLGDFISVEEGTARLHAYASGCSVGAESERAACEARVWREAAKHCQDVPKGHLPDYFNSIADEVDRAARKGKGEGK